MNRICKDHLGNTYASLKDMLAFWNIPKSAYHARIKRGWTLQKALETPVNPGIVTDHLGNKYNSISDMCKFWNIERQVYYSRINQYGWPVEKALTTPSGEIKGSGMSQKCIDYLGHEYESIQKMCDAHNNSVNAVYHRLKKGIPVSSPALFPSETNIYWQKHYVTDHLGNQFSSIKEMCKHYGISLTKYKRDKRAGLSLKDILTVKRDYTVYDHLGNSFPSLRQMCEHYGITDNLFCSRRRKGWSLEECLTIPISDDNKAHNIIINNMIFGSYGEACMFYGTDTSLMSARMHNGYTREEAITIPRNMYIGEYRVAQCLKRLNVRFYHDCTIKTIFTELSLSIKWPEFLNELHHRLCQAGYKWSKSKIQKLRPDFVIYTDGDNRILGIIEYDGEQHQNFIEFFFKTIEEFFRRSNADFVKQSLWEYLNIPMLRIRYDQIDMIDDMVQDFIDNSQNYIHKHNTYLSEDDYWTPLQDEKKRIDLAFAS